MLSARRLLSALASLMPLAFVTPALHAQTPEKGKFPPGWHARADDPAQPVDSVVFSTMPPGWHVTTGPTVILYHPDSTAAGNYRVELETFLFDPGRRREGFGLFIGGRDLEGAAQRYTYFLIRHDGQFIIKQRRGAEAPTLQDWTATPAVKKWADHGTQATVKNVLAVDVGPDTAVFFVNDSEVQRMPRSQLDAEGIVGLRVSHALNLHITRIAITKKS